MDSTVFIALLILVLIGGIVRGISGFGPAVVLIGFGSLIHVPKEVVAIASFLDFVGGFWAISKITGWQKFKDCIWVILAFGLGSVIGAIVLGFTDIAVLQILIAFLVGISAVVLLIKPSFEIPSSQSAQDVSNKVLVPGIAGIVGGVVGMPGPLLSVYYAFLLPPKELRQILIPVFFAGALLRTLTYSITSQFPLHAFYIALLLAPAALIGIGIGDRFHKFGSQKQVRYMIAIVLIACASLLMIKSSSL